MTGLFRDDPPPQWRCEYCKAINLDTRQPEQHCECGAVKVFDKYAVIPPAPDPPHVRFDADLKQRTIRVIGEYQAELEAAIECHLAPDTKTPAPCDEPVVEELRKKWRAAEDIVRALEAVNVQA